MATFGYTGTGNLERSMNSNFLYGYYLTATGTGPVSKATAYIDGNSPYTDIKIVIVRKSDDTIISDGVSSATTTDSSAYKWYDFTFSPEPIIQNGIDYWLCAIVGSETGGYQKIKYNDIGGDYCNYDTVNSYTSPVNPTWDGTDDYDAFCIYLTYEQIPGWPGGSVHGVSNDDISKVTTIDKINIDEIHGV